MLFNYFFLSLSVSLDSFGIGITYGIKNTKISVFAKFILFIIAIIFSFISHFIGKLLYIFVSGFIIEFISSFLLFIIGGWVIVQGLFSKDNSFSDFDNSNKIDWKEALFLGFSLSIDLLGIGIESYFIGMNIFLFSFLVRIFPITVSLNWNKNWSKDNVFL